MILPPILPIYKFLIVKNISKDIFSLNLPHIRYLLVVIVYIILYVFILNNLHFFYLVFFVTIAFLVAAVGSFLFFGV